MKRILLTILGALALLLLGVIIWIGLDPAGFVNCFIARSATASAQIAQTAPQVIADPSAVDNGLAALSVFVLLVLGIVGGALLYFLPTFIGSRKRNGVAIFVLNLLTGWSFIGWVGSLVWACVEDNGSKHVSELGQ